MDGGDGRLSGGEEEEEVEYFDEESGKKEPVTKDEAISVSVSVEVVVVVIYELRCWLRREERSCRW